MSEDTKVLVALRVPTFMAEALQKAAAAELTNVTHVCRTAVLKDLRARGLVAA
jgi:hypothetical protein